MNDTINKIKFLREKTSAGFIKCKEALAKSDGNTDKALKILEEDAIALASNKNERITKEGIIYSYIHSGSKIGVLIELNCETDFVAKREEFKILAKNLSMQIAAFSNIKYLSLTTVPEEIILNKMSLLKNSLSSEEKKEYILNELKSETLLNQNYLYNEDITVEDYIKTQITLLGENIKISKFCKFILGD